MKRRSKLLILAVVAAALCCLLVMMTSGANASGTCGADGDNLTWTFVSSTGKLIISGTGDMADYSYNSVPSIPWNSYRSSIKAVEIAEGVTSIGHDAFYGCRSLTSIEIPSSVTSIGYRAFRGCNSLTSIEIPEGVTIIESYAFFGCESITSIEIPSSVTNIGWEAFEDCSSLYVIYNNSDLSLTISSSDYGGVAQNAKLIVDKDGNKIYKIYNNGGAEYIDTEDDFLFQERDGNYQLIAYFGKEEAVALPQDINGNIYEIYQMRGVRNVIIPDGVTSIGDNAFSNCRSLTSIDIPSSVTSIGYRAFQGCNSLTSIDIPDGVKIIGGNTFSGCERLTSIEIPSSVTSIGSYAFFGCKSLTSIEIPSSVTSIGSYAFSGCESLTSIEIPSNVTSIGEYAFEACSGLMSVTFRENSQLTSIGDYTFHVCRNLTSIKIPSSVTSIGDNVFHGCRGLESIAVSEENSVYHSAGNCIIETASKTLVAGCKSSVIPADGSVTSIGSYAFFGCESITSIKIPSSVTSIGSSAFTSCSSMTSVTFGEDSELTSIGYRAFQGCSSLTNIEIPLSVTIIGDRAFSGCSSLTSIEIPLSVTIIGGYAFSGCSNLTSIEIPSSVTSIGSYAFFGCKSLTSIEIPLSVTSIGSYAFSGGNSLYVINNNSDLALTIGSSDYGGVAQNAILIIDKNGNKTYRNDGAEYVDTEDGFLFRKQYGSYQLIAYFGREGTVTLPQDIDGNSYAIWRMRGVRNVIIPDDVTSIGKEAFYGCYSIMSIVISEGVTSIGDSAFYKCSSLEGVVIPKGIISIGKNAFDGCNALTNIEIPSSVTSIGSSAFASCNNMTSITFGENSQLTSIGEQAFYGCSKLKYNEYDNGLYLGNDKYPYIILMKVETTGITSCKIHEQTQVIADSAFHSCSNLTSIKIPSSVTSIGSGAFYNCSSLINIEIPSSVTSIGSGAFYNCSSLINIEIPSSITDIGSSAFYGCDSLKYNAYDNGLYLGNAQNPYVALIDVKTIDITSCIIHEQTKVIYSAFHSCTSLTSIEIPSSVTSIGDGAFSWCYSLTSIKIPSSVTSIGDDAFSWCGRLKSVIFYKNSQLMSIGSSAFHGCNSLMNIELPSNMTSIGDSAFYECSSLTDIEIPSSVTSVGNWAFWYCSSLTSIAILSRDVEIYDNGGTIPATATIYGYAGSTAQAYAEKYGHTFVALDEPTHEHTYGEWEKYDETQHKHTCSCGNVEYADHTWDNGKITTEPTSTLQGVKTYTCTACGATKTEIIPPTTIYSGTCGAKGDNLTWTFDSTTGKLTISGTGEMEDYDGNSSAPWSSYRNSIKIVEIAEGVTSIGANAFYSCGSLERIEIPSSIKYIPVPGMFWYCNSLTEFVVDSENPSWLSIDGVLFYETHKIPGILGSAEGIVLACYPAGKNDSIYTIPDNVTCIREYAFFGCSNLTSIEIPSSVTSIGDNAFWYCSSLTSITILSRDVEIYDSSYTIPTTATIYGYAGSTAQAYAEQYGHTFVALTEEPYAPGDINGDETINSDDAIYLLKHTFLPEQYPLSGSGDMNGDGKVDSDDAVYLLKHTFLPEQYPLP